MDRPRMHKPDSHFCLLDPLCTADPHAPVRPLTFARRAVAGAPPRGRHRARASVSGRWERRGAWSGRDLPRSHSRDRRQEEGYADWLSKAKEESGSGSGPGGAGAVRRRLHRTSPQCRGEGRSMDDETSGSRRCEALCCQERRHSEKRRAGSGNSRWAWRTEHHLVGVAFWERRVQAFALS